MTRFYILSWVAIALYHAYRGIEADRSDLVLLAIALLAMCGVAWSATVDVAKLRRRIEKLEDRQ